MFAVAGGVIFFLYRRNKFIEKRLKFEMADVRNIAANNVGDDINSSIDMKQHEHDGYKGFADERAL